MSETIMQLPRTQLRGKYTQDANAALWIGDARCVVVQWFASFGSSADEVEFQALFSTARNDGQFIGLGVGTTLSGATGAYQTEITLLEYKDLPGFMSIVVIPEATNSEPVVVSVQVNLKK